MPMYDFKCNDCGHIEEYFYNMGDIPTSHECEKCKGEMSRMYCYAPPIHFSSDFKEENKIKYDKSPSGKKRFY
jgi:putative FmdB family regulatory protein